MILLAAYLGGAVLDLLRLGASILRTLARGAAVVGVLLVLDGCAPADVLPVGLVGVAVGVAVVAFAVPKFRGRLLALAAGLGGLGFLLGFLGLGRRGRVEQRREVGEARRDAVVGRREKKKADKVEGREAEKIGDSMEGAAGQTELGGSDDDLGELLELGARRRRERKAGKPPTEGAP